MTRRTTSTSGNEPATEQEVISLGAAVGRNVRRLRQDRVLTQHEMAQQWRRCGLDWARSKVSALEAGNRDQVSASDLALMALALQVPISELFAGLKGTWVLLVPNEAAVKGEELADLLGGGSPDVELTVGGSAWAAHVQHVERLEREKPAKLDVELAQRLGVAPKRVVEVAFKMFDGLSLTEERDRRVERLGTHSVQERQAHRGHITRELTAMVERELQEGSGA